MKIAILTYDSRSGSTFFSAELDKLSGVVVTPESAYITRLIEAEKISGDIFSKPENVLGFLNCEVHFKELDLLDDRLLGKLACVKLNAATVVNIVTKEVARRYASPEARVMIIKTPVFDHFAEIEKSCFPGVKYIHLIRDPRAVHLSKANSINLEGHPFSTNSLKTALKWRYKIRSAENYLTGNPAALINVRYEDLLENTAEQVSMCAKFLGVPVSVGESSYEKKIGKAQSHLHGNIGKGAIKSRSEAWRDGLSEADKNVISFLCRRQITMLGYSAGKENFMKVLPQLIWLTGRYSMSSISGMVKNIKNNPELVRSKCSYLLHVVTGK